MRDVPRAAPPRGRPALRPDAALPTRAALAELAGTRHLVVAGAREPVAFFAYPGLPGGFVPDGCSVHVLAEAGDDATEALCALADELRGDAAPELSPEQRPDLPTGPLTTRTLAAAIGALLPAGAIVVDEAITSGAHLAEATAGCPRHDWLTLTGGAIGQGMPVATGAAVACPDRPVVSVQADGSAMYTLTALWTQAREQLDVTTVICDNGAYAILAAELDRVGAASDGVRARQLLDLTGPALDFVALATGMGVPARRATTADELVEHLRWALGEPGPHLVDAQLS